MGVILMAAKYIEVTISFSWWFRYLYKPGTRVAAMITGNPLDVDRYRYWMGKAVIVKIGNKRV